MTIAGVDEAKTRLRVQATGDTAGTRTSKDIPTPSRSAPLDFGCSRPENQSCQADNSEDGGKPKKVVSSVARRT